MVDYTFASLFAESILAEEVMRDVYLGLAVKFAAYPTIVKFWENLATEELIHIREIKRLQEKLSPEQLAGIPDASMMLAAQLVSRVSAVQALKQVMDLQDAFELASDLENSETNTIFEFIIKNFVTDAQAIEFILKQLRGHIAKLMEFSSTFGDVEQRRLIVAANI